MFNKEFLTKERIKKITSIESLIICILLFIAATYAWFTDIATLKDNSIQVGNSFISIISSRENVLDILDPNDEEHKDAATILKPYEDYVYTRNYDSKSYDVYYKISDIDGNPIPCFELYNFAPGQTRTIEVTYLNRGSLAFKCVGYFVIDVSDDNEDLSFTGLETLNQQYKGDFRIFRNKYYGGDVIDLDINSFSEGYLFDDFDTNTSKNFAEYQRRFNKLLNKQTVNVTDESGGVYKYLTENDTEPTKLVDIVDVGGHLEDVLKVFVSVGGVDTSFGTIKHFNDLMLNGPSAIEGTDLYIEYQKYVNLVTNYVIPVSSITTGDYISKDGKSITLKQNKSDASGEALNNIKEINSVKFKIVMPKDTNDLYQNASIILKACVNASQVGFDNNVIYLNEDN